MSTLFQIKDLHASIEGKEILKGINLTIKAGEVHALMGRNGCGKTTLSYTLMGHPKYKISQGEVLLDGEKINNLTAAERAKKRMFLAFQYPVAIPGVTVANFLRASLRAVRGDEVPSKEFRALIKKELVELSIPESFMTRSLNEGFSGGEKKRLETLQMRLLKPKFAILDETDSGLDIDALRQISQKIDELRSNNIGILLITHYQRMLDYIKPDHVHIMMNGKIVKSAGPELALTLEEKGYDWVKDEETA